MRVFCFRSGVIGFGSSTPSDALEIASTRKSKALREIIEINARHAKTGDTLLVPGIPEANNEEEALDACERFKKLVAMRLMGEKGWPAAIPRKEKTHGHAEQ